ncbi:MAG: cytochrome P450 family protein [Trebonia sp.]
MSDDQAVVDLTGAPQDALTVFQDAQPVRRVKLPNGVPVWLVTRYADVREVLNDPRMSNRDRVDWFDQGALNAQVRAAMNSHMLRIDPPDHTRLRKLVNKVFVPRRIESLRPRVRQVTSDLLEKMAASGPVTDVVAQYASPVPVQVICELLGVPAEDRDSYRGWADAFAAGIGAPVFPVHEITDFVEHLRGLIARRRAEPDNALLSALIAARDANDRLSEDELVSTAFLFIIAGHETSTNLIGSGLYLLLRSPDRADRIRAHPEELAPAIEEFLRYEGPVTAASLRTATCDLNLSGAEVAGGDLVMVSLRAANRDGGVFREPSEFRTDRNCNVHLAFGHGIHFCMGAPLARMEAQIAIAEFLTRFPKARLAQDPGSVEWRPGVLTRGLASLPVSLDG